MKFTARQTQSGKVKVFEVVDCTEVSARVSRLQFFGHRCASQR